jgi:hypothetical protein
MIMYFWLLSPPFGVLNWQFMAGFPLTRGSRLIPASSLGPRPTAVWRLRSLAAKNVGDGLVFQHETYGKKFWAENFLFSNYQRIIRELKCRVCAAQFNARVLSNELAAL